jgi:pyridoxine 4-oxidase
MGTHFDILVVGAGTAGCVIASRLSENPACRAGLIEAGGPATDPDIADPLKWGALQGRSFDWAHRTVPQPFTANRVHEWPRGRILGGSSALNAMAHVRGHRRDFDCWAEAGGRRWSYDGLLPGFIRSEERLGVWLPDAEVSPVVRAYMAAGEALGAPRLGHHNGGELAGTAPNTLTIRNGRRVTAADAYLTPDVLTRPNLSLLLEHDVEQLTFSGARATGAAIAHAGETRHIEADRIVLCLGAVATPLLLMRSGIGDPEALAAAGISCRFERREVGRNLQDHLLILGNVYAARKAVPPSRLQHSESLMYLHSDDVTRACGSPDIVLACVVAPVASEQFIAPAYGSAFTLLSGVTHPTSRGAITVTGPGRNDPPRIDPHYLETEYDRVTARRALEIAREIGHHPALDEWRSHEALPGAGADLDLFIARAASTHHHPAGTCRMGRDQDAVVDEHLNVRGIGQLSIADASVIPRLTAGPINAAVMAIAETWAASQIKAPVSC